MNLVEEMSNKPEIKVLLELMRLSNTEAYNHSLSVAMIAESMLGYTNHSLERKKEIITGALLHDIGKIFIPLNLTQLPQCLEEQEFNIIKVHASVSYEIVKSAFSKIVQDICLYHHERPNGSGYLGEIPPEIIPPEVFLVQVADVYDALTSERSYKKCYDKESAVRILKEEANQLKLDKEYVNLLNKILQIEEE